MLLPIGFKIVTSFIFTGYTSVKHRVKGDVIGVRILVVISVAIFKMVILILVNSFRVTILAIGAGKSVTQIKGILIIRVEVRLKVV